MKKLTKINGLKRKIQQQFLWGTSKNKPQKYKKLKS
jgi:hypothetical protein